MCTVPGLGSVINDKTKREQIKPYRLTFIRQMCDGIQAVHDAGFIHRDVCPRNFIVHHDMQWLKLIDFGLTLPNESVYRQPGNRTGTPQYMAPEIVRRRQTDLRVDIFALGVSLYRLLTFVHPWGSTDTSGMAALVHDQRPHTDILELRPNLNKDLAKAVNMCLAPLPDDRPDSVSRILRMIRKVEFEGRRAGLMITLEWPTGTRCAVMTERANRGTGEPISVSIPSGRLLGDHTPIAEF